MAELILVLVVVALLFAIVVVSVRGIEGDATDSDCRTELRRIKVATEQFYAELGVYPPSRDALLDGGFVKAADVRNHIIDPAGSAKEPTYRGTGPCA